MTRTPPLNQAGLGALLERVKAERGDRSIDAAVYNALYAGDFRPLAFHSFDQKFLAVNSRYHDGWLIGKDTSDIYAENLPRFSSSLDAAVALCEKILPGWEWYVNGSGHAGVRETVYDMNFPGDAKTPALALLAALLRAMIAGKGDGG